MQDSLGDAEAPGCGRLSRRGFLARSAAGGACLALAPALGLWAPATANAQERTSAGHLDSARLDFDGKAVAVVQQIVGGNTVLGLVDPVFNDPRPVTRSVNELVLSVSHVSRTLTDWVQASLAGTAAPRNVLVRGYIYGGATGQFTEVYRHELIGARLAAFAGLDVDPSVVRPFTLGLALGAEQTSFKWLTGQPPATLPAPGSAPARYPDVQAWIQGLDATLAGVNWHAWKGLRRRPDGQWASGPLALTLPAQHAGPLQEWMDLVLRGQASERQGGIRIYNRDRSKVIATVDFPALGISSIGMPIQGDLGFDTVLVECYCRGGAKFNLNGLMM